MVFTYDRVYNKKKFPSFQGSKLTFDCHGDWRVFTRMAELSR
ncbi:hypothetical protein SAMN05421810_10527 [Amycolatopsis arida]|uniref:Uncharacterized protein n=1 Tax=Amycolatopsis arida TaxID=587909 RepID=A0A1I5WBN1_9PSEU|nr:hypothetical protein CLV69_10546 [Amycolatopsis arida]SFQ17055.1 hypothetical protein SAMN05421810_10527 [Amycolatopsis arida]